MKRPAATLGMRHVALNIRDITVCEHFYVDLLGMEVEWRPDADNVYLTSGHDNLALHRVDDVAAAFQSAANNPINDARVYNIVGERCPVSRVVEEIKRIIPAAHINAAGPELPVCANINAGTLRDDFSTIPLTSLSQGLQATVDFYRAAV